ANAPIIAIAAVIAALVLGIVELVKHWDEITQKFPILGQAADAVKKGLGDLVEWFETVFTPKFSKAFDAVSQKSAEVWAGVQTAAGNVKTWFTQNWGEIQPLL